MILCCPNCRTKSVKLQENETAHCCKNCGRLFELNDIPFLIAQFKLNKEE